MLEPEDAFAEEAQEEARLAERRPLHGEPTITTSFHIGDAQDAENETSPLMSSRQRRKDVSPDVHGRASYERAINEPWTGAYGVGDLPWYKKPSV
jgi:hypothetical protein